MTTTLSLNGTSIIPTIIPPGGSEFWVNPSHADANNSNGNAGVGAPEDYPMATIEAAIALMASGVHDVLHYVAGGTSINLAAAVDWSNSYAHFVGHCAPSRTAQRARIFQTSSLTGADPLWTVSGSGCIFQNFYIFQGVDDATSLKNFSVEGGRNYFENIHFAGGGHATQAVDGGASLHLNGAEANVFKDCTIGVDTIDAATGMSGILVDGESTRNRFYDCDITIKAGNAGANWLELVDSEAIDRYMLFKRCFFNNNSATALTAGFVLPAGFSPPRGPIFLQDCMAYGATIWEAGSRGVIMGNMNAVTGAALSGVANELVT